MGTKAREIAGANVDKIIESLNKALADEWLAYYQYWIGAKVAVGPMRSEVAAELEQHAGEELAHAGMLAERIIQLGGTPVLKPEDWYKLTNCGYEAPEDPYVRPLLEQNIKGEQCAIRTYSSLLENLRDRVTYHIVVEILEDENEHEEDLQMLLEDIDEMVKRELGR